MEPVSQNERTPLLIESRGSVGGTIFLTTICGIFAVGLVCGIYLILKEGNFRALWVYCHRQTYFFVLYGLL